VQLVCALLHLLTTWFCFRIGERLRGRVLGLIFAALVSLAPIYFINIYTVTDFTFSAALNAAAIYYFLCGFEGSSFRKLFLAAALYSLSCFHLIYSLLLLVFFAAYASYRLFSSWIPQAQQGLMPGKAASYAFRIFFGAGFLYAALLLQPIIAPRGAALFFISLAAFTCWLVVSFSRLLPAAREKIKFCLFFPAAVACALLLLDLFIQLDIRLLKEYFGYYRDSAFAGSFGTHRVFFYFSGQPVKVLGVNIYYSVLSSIFAFTGSYAKGSLSAFSALRMMADYYGKCFPAAVLFAAGAGLIGLCIDMALIKLRRRPLGAWRIFALLWFASLSLTFANLGQYHGRRIFLLPMPYFFAALGVDYLARLLAAGLKKRIYPAAALALAAALTAHQLIFLKREVFAERFKFEKISPYGDHLFHNWDYGRSFREVGEFILRDAPLKKDGRYRSVFIYSVPPLWFYNNIDWYLQNKLKVVYSDRPTAYAYYGKKESLEGFLRDMFASSADIQAVYFADFLAVKPEERFFSLLHPEVAAYQVFSDRSGAGYDCLLYKFVRQKGRSG
jgi:hypothetical protein